MARLSTRLAREAPQLAIRQFAVEVDDPSGDLIGSVLLLAMSHSGRTADLLSELASTIRERATMRLRIEAERGGQRAEARFVLGFGIAVIVGVVIFGRGTSFLDAYDTATGQLVLALVVCAVRRRDLVAPPARPLRASGPVPARGRRRGGPMMLLAIAAAMGFAGGVWLIVSAIWPPRPSLADALARLHAPGEPTRRSSRPLRRRAVVVRAGRLLLRREKAGVLVDDRTTSDLAVVARPLEVYAGTCASVRVVRARRRPDRVGAAIGGRSCSVLVPIWISLLGAVGFLVPRLVLRAEAAKARSDFRHALSAYLDVLVLLLAAGEGPEGAMETAARARQRSGVHRAAPGHGAGPPVG